MASKRGRRGQVPIGGNEASLGSSSVRGDSTKRPRRTAADPQVCHEDASERGDFIFLEKRPAFVVRALLPKSCCDCLIRFLFIIGQHQHSLYECFEEILEDRLFAPFCPGGT